MHISHRTQPHNREEDNLSMSSDDNPYLAELMPVPSPPTPITINPNTTCCAYILAELNELPEDKAKRLRSILNRAMCDFFRAENEYYKDLFTADFGNLTNTCGF